MGGMNEKRNTKGYDCLVIGGGIAGLQSALDLADQGYRVLIVEKEPSIGGRMISLRFSQLSIVRVVYAHRRWHLLRIIKTLKF